MPGIETFRPNFARPPGSFFARPNFGMVHVLFSPFWGAISCSAHVLILVSHLFPGRVRGVHKKEPSPLQSCGANPLRRRIRNSKLPHWRRWDRCLESPSHPKYKRVHDQPFWGVQKPRFLRVLETPGGLTKHFFWVLRETGGFNPSPKRTGESSHPSRDRSIGSARRFEGASLRPGALETVCFERRSFAPKETIAEEGWIRFLW